MTNWPVHAAWNGPIVMIGFGSIGRGTLAADPAPYHMQSSADHGHRPRRVPQPAGRKAGRRLHQGRPHRKNYRHVLKPLLTAGPGQAFIVNLSVDVDSLDIMRLARETNSLYIDTVIEPWAGFYYNTKTR